jgi:hypothetical protein
LAATGLAARQFLFPTLEELCRPLATADAVRRNTAVPPRLEGLWGEKLWTMIPSVAIVAQFHGRFG